VTQLSNCIDTPISWFQLDRRATGELGPVEDKRIENHLQQCDACRAGWHEIQTATRELRPLPTPSSPSASFLERWKRWLWPAVLVPALAAIVLFVVIGRQQPGEVDRFHGSDGLVKGGDTTLSLLREHEGDVATDPSVYVSGDRFRLLVSCASPTSSAWDVVAYQDGQAFFPFDPGQSIGCGNEVAIPGAFRVTGTSPVTICLLLGKPLPERSWLATSAPGDLNEDAACRQVSAAKL
jgi:hypothetical protein